MEFEAQYILGYGFYLKGYEPKIVEYLSKVADNPFSYNMECGDSQNFQYLSYISKNIDYISEEVMFDCSTILNIHTEQPVLLFGASFSEDADSTLPEYVESSLGEFLESIQRFLKNVGINPNVTYFNIQD